VHVSNEVFSVGYGNALIKLLNLVKR